MVKTPKILITASSYSAATGFFVGCSPCGLWLLEFSHWKSTKSPSSAAESSIEGVVLLEDSLIFLYRCGKSSAGAFCSFPCCILVVCILMAKEDVVVKSATGIEGSNLWFVGGDWRAAWVTLWCSVTELMPNPISIGVVGNVDWQEHHCKFLVPVLLEWRSEG